MNVLTETIISQRNTWSPSYHNHDCLITVVVLIVVVAVAAAVVVDVICVAIVVVVVDVLVVVLLVVVVVVIVVVVVVIVFLVFSTQFSLMLIWAIGGTTNGRSVSFRHRSIIWQRARVVVLMLEPKYIRLLNGVV